MSISNPVTAVTAAGAVEGRRTGQVVTWLGIPYAAPPVGPRRLRSPTPVARWDGVRPALRAAGAATQSKQAGAPPTSLGSAVGEDCLYLNVSSPAADDGLRPVLVWIHGGAFTSGSGALYPGRHLAALGDVVVVTLNYRLGVFGFVDLAGACGADVPSNLGFRDVVAALQWVRENVAAFGGDPDAVTVAGESAGSVLVSLLTCAPAAAGLFRAAICQSGSYTLLHGELQRAEVAQRYVRELGITRADDLWNLSGERLLAAQVAVGEAMHATTPAAPWFDGDVLPASLADARAATRPELPLLAGSNRDEVVLFDRLRTDILLMGRRELTERLRDALGDVAGSAVLARYPQTRAGTSQLSTDLNFAMPTANFAERHAAAGGATFTYRFDASTPWLRACHAAELPYLWNWSGTIATVMRGRATAARRGLAVRMQRHWVGFVRDGRPGPGWPAYEPQDRRTLLFDPAGDRVEADPAGYRRAGWAGLDVMAHP